jgi:hypothetical protein
MKRNRSEKNDERLLKPEALEVAREEERDHAEDRQRLVNDRHERRERHAENVIGDRQGRTSRRFRQDDDQ